MKKLLLIGLALLFGFQTAQAQLGVDVKTKFSEKSELRAVKDSFIGLLKYVDGLNRQEFNETYQIFFTNLQQTNYNGNYTSSVDVQIKKPALFGRGDVVGSFTVKNSYTQNDINQFGSSGGGNFSLLKSVRYTPTDRQGLEASLLAKNALAKIGQYIKFSY